MRIYCIEKKPLKYDDLHICSHQNYMQMINHQINKKRVGFCLLFSTFFFKHFRPGPQYSDYFRMELSDGFPFQGLCRLCLKPPWRKVSQRAVSVSAHHWMVSCERRKADSVLKKYMLV